MSSLWLMLKRWVVGGRPQITTSTNFDTPSSSSAPTIEPQTPTEPSAAVSTTDATLGQNPDASTVASSSSPTRNTSDAAADGQTTTSTTTAEAITKSQDHIIPLAEPTTNPSPGLATTTTSTSLPTPTTTTALAATTTAQAASPEDGSYSGGIGSTKTKLAIALPIAIVGLLVFIGLIWFYLRRRRRQRQRNAQSTFDMAANQTTAVSTSQLMTIPKPATPEPVGSIQPHLPVLDVPLEQSHKHSPGSASARSPDDLNTELGLAVAVPMNQRMSATEHDLRGLGRSESTIGAGAAGIRLPFQNHHGDDDDDDDDDDTVSVVSDLNERRDQEHEFDDFSSVSSFNDDQPRTDHQGHVSG